MVPGFSGAAAGGGGGGVRVSGPEKGRREGEKNAWAIVQVGRKMYMCRNDRGTGAGGEGTNARRKFFFMFSYTVIFIIFHILLCLFVCMIHLCDYVTCTVRC